MPPPQYVAIPGEGNESPTTVDYPPQPRPVTYYGDGEFDAPSSDNEEEVFLEKKPTHEALDSELGGEGSDDEGELVVGGKVCWPILERCKLNDTGR